MGPVEFAVAVFELQFIIGQRAGHGEPADQVFALFGIGVDP